MADAPEPGRRARRAAVLEVVAVTALAHLGYKALELVEPAGQNLAPGLTLAAFALLAFVRHRRSHVDFGLRPLPRPWIWSCATALVVLGGVVVWWQARDLAILAWSRDESSAVRTVAGVVLARFVVVGWGEELFFRGYLQGRLDRSFGTRWRLLGARVGPGWILAAVLFGAIHAFNPTLWFRGEFDVSLAWGAATTLTGLVFGWLRAVTGSVWAPAFVHGATGALRALTA